MGGGVVFLAESKGSVRRKPLFFFADPFVFLPKSKGWKVRGLKLSISIEDFNAGVSLRGLAVVQNRLRYKILSTITRSKFSTPKAATLWVGCGHDFHH